MAKVALITGVTGQDGSYLAEFLIKQGYEVHGAVRRTSSFATGRIDHMRKGFGPGSSPLQLHYGDLDDSTGLRAIVEQVRPDDVYNLAAQSHVRISFDQPEYTADVVGLGALRLLEALRDHNKRHGRAARYYQAGSSEMFGRVAEVPQRETTPFHPRSPYACAKIYAHWQTINYREAYGLFATNGILFNHESPRRGENFVSQDHPQRHPHQARHAGQARAGQPRRAPRLGLCRRLRRSDVDDAAARASRRLCHRHRRNPFRAGFPRARVRLLKLDWRKCIQTDPRYLRPAEVDLLQGDASKARRLLGWQPRVNFEQLVEADLELAERERRSRGR